MFLSKLKRLHGDATEAPWDFVPTELRDFLQNKAEAIIALVEAAKRINSEHMREIDGKCPCDLCAALSNLNAEES